MFPSVCERMLYRHSLTFTALRSFCSSNSRTVYKKKSGNQIKLVGRLQNQVLSLQNGFDSFLISTANKSLGKLTGVDHKIKANEDVTSNIPLKQLREKDLVYISGEISYRYIPNGAKQFAVPHIFAKKILRIEADDNHDDLEQLEKESVNEVKLTGFIGSKIVDEKATVFSIVTNNDLSSIISKDILRGDFHRVLILDNSLRDFVRKNVQLSDRIAIDGELIYNKFQLEDGKFVSQGFILPKRIQKFSQFTHKAEVQSKPDEGAEAQNQQ